MTLAEPPTPDKASLIRFLLTCPMLQRLSASQLDPLASRLKLKRYDDGADLLSAVGPHRRTPLRVIVHGHASWEPSTSSEQRGAWMLIPGSVFGLDAVNEWAHAHGIQGAWPLTDLDHVRCKSAGPLWVLELAAEHFDEVFTDAQCEATCSELLCMFPTTIHATQVVAALRQTPQFARVSTPKLYRLLERAPTLDYGPPPAQQQQQQQQAIQVEQVPIAPVGPQGKFVTGPALYYVLSGELQVSSAEQIVSLRAGQIGGPDLLDTSGLMAASAAQAVSNARAVVLTQRALFDMIRCDPGIARSLGPRSFGQGVNP
jgi:hypothetical protein